MIPPSVFLLDERVFMTLGILRVAAVLEEAGVGVELLDLSGVKNFEEAVRDHVAASAVRCYGLTATTPQMPAAAKICAAIRSERPGARIILGGPHVTLVHAASLSEEKRGVSGRATAALGQLQQMFDVLVAGDGERAVFEALKAKPRKLIDGDDPRTVLFLRNQDLTALPFPARHLVDVDSYQYSVDGVRALSIIAQLGCPFGCGFCGGRMSPSLRRIRTRTSENVVQEMVHVYEEYGVTGFMFYDDELNVNPKIVELMELIGGAQQRLGVEFRLRGFVKAELFTDAQAAAMARAGFRWILTGFESGHERILANIQKRATRDDNTRCMAIARRHGLKVKALMSVGHPGESPETVRATRDWLLEVRPDDFDATVITTYPGTPYFDEAIETSPRVWTYTAKGGDRLHSLEVDYAQVAEYYKGVPGEYTSYTYTDHLSATELTRQRDWLEADVRAALGIPYHSAAPSVRYDHSMGQGAIPGNILRRTIPRVAA
jgi:radical SAM superfamily enzyme YgiQ (UPF0313 family)